MEDNLFDIFDGLNIEEMSLLLDQDFDLHIDKKVKKRIISSVRDKSQLNFGNNENILDKFRNILKYLFISKRLVTLCTIFMLFLGSGGYLYAQIPVAYVSLDINPSIELALNKFNKVVSYEAYNLDGETLLASNNGTHIPLDKAINNIIADAVNQNYISSSKDSAITLSAISDDTIFRKGLEIHLKNEIENNLENRSIHISVISSNNNLAKRDEAKSIGFTVGKLLLVEELKSLDSSILIEDFKNMSILRIKNKILEFKNNSCNNDFTNNTLHSIDKNTRRIDNTSNTSNIAPNNSNNGNASIALPSNNGNASIALPSNSNNKNTFSVVPNNDNKENVSIILPGNSNNENTFSSIPSNSNNENNFSAPPSNINNENASNDGLDNSNNGNASNDGPGNSNNGNASNNEHSNKDKNKDKDKDKNKNKNYGSNLYKDGDIILKSYAGEI